MLKSLAASNANARISVYCMHTALTKADMAYIRFHAQTDNLNVIFIRMADDAFLNAPTVDRYPREVYFRLLAGKYLPKSVKRALYLDVDIIVKGDLTELYNSPLGGKMFMASTNVGRFMLAFNKVRLMSFGERVYPNTGVLLMDVDLMRRFVDEDEISEFIKKHRAVMMLFDQDVMFSLYGDKIALMDGKIYNLSDRQIKACNVVQRAGIDKAWVDKNAVIIHYLGKNKPWKADYRGILKSYYDAFEFFDETIN